MKSSQLICLLTAVGLGSVCVVSHLDAQAGAGSGAVAVCNVVEILNNCQKAKDLTAELNKERGRIEKEVEKRTEAIKSIDKELELLTVGSTEYEQRFAERQRLGINREAWLKFEQTKAMRRHQKLTREMYLEVQKAVGAVARGRGFKVVLHQQRGQLRGANAAEMRAEISQRKVVYSDQTVDITAGVLSSLNAAYRAKP